MGAHAASLDRIRALGDVLGPPPWTLGQLHQVGWTTRQLQWAVNAGRLARPSRGLVVPVDEDDRAQLLTRCRAALMTAPSRAAVSHDTACTVEGLWLPAEGDDLVQLTSPGTPDSTRHGVRIHGSALDESWVTEVDGIRITRLERSAVDAARGRTFAQALVVLDSAARALVVADTRDAWVLRDPERRGPAVERARARLRPAYDSVRGWPGGRVVGRVLEHVDPCSESPYESWSRGLVIDAGLPLPEVAVPVRGASGRGYYADLLWRDARIIGEADGWSKYGEGTRARTAVRGERERQRDLEAAGWTVVRWDPGDSAAAIVHRLARALARTSLP